MCGVAVWMSHSCAPPPASASSVRERGRCPRAGRDATSTRASRRGRASPRSARRPARRRSRSRTCARGRTRAGRGRAVHPRRQPDAVPSSRGWAQRAMTSSKAGDPQRPVVAGAQRAPDAAAHRGAGVLVELEDRARIGDPPRQLARPRRRRPGRPSGTGPARRDRGWSPCPHVTMCPNVRRGGSSTQLARVFGIRIGASPGWFLFLFLMIWWLSGVRRRAAGREQHHHLRHRGRRRVLFFLSIALHELATRSSPGATASRCSGSTCGSSAAWPSSRATRVAGRGVPRRGRGTRGDALLIACCAAVGVPSGVAPRLGRQPARAQRRQLAGAGAAVLAGARQRRTADLQPGPRVPARRRADRAAVAWRVTGDRHRATRLAGRLGQGFAYLLIGLGLFLLATATPGRRHLARSSSGGS